ncbi:peptide-methionine (S)-S-oxide reductase MsrA [Acuticoccus sp. MNP-M23]|uniref:peptide-methionine (S)-S-oxide reductase MsrA n=1 Tax=Acuticoccus sp. MNP-M23 TaxID=3072793 RepID=UPI0028154090|nr:peptide-methionine (S)-S-oxide reductase MsrA [Acuticoccus sp. MNP-M23]WMS42205.1 peptide-methionine (S)-S-oxide reductase MsrA [Acuticoccus sp. MNP-M23]
MIDRVRIAATATALVLGFSTGYASAAEPKTAVFAGGCFWCVEADFDKVDGVLSTVSGFAGGALENPSYKDVTYGDTGHYEVVEISYDPDKVTYRTLVDYLLRHIDPTDDGGQFCDRGDSYRTAIFAGDADERAAAEAAVADANAALDGAVVTPVLDAAPFYPAEDYHQDYYSKNPLRYRYYRYSCGRDARIDEVWRDAKGS